MTQKYLVEADVIIIFDCTAPTSRAIKDNYHICLSVDSIAVSVFADILIELTNTVSDGKIQITILILRRGALSKLGL